MLRKGIVYLVLLFYCLTFVLGVQTLPAEATGNVPQFTIKTSATKVKPGDYFTLEIWLDTVEQKVYGAEVTLHYDSAIVERVAYADTQPYQKGSDYNSEFAVFQNQQEATQGDLTYAAVTQQAQFGSLHLVSFKFKAKEKGDAHFSLKKSTGVVAINSKLTTISYAWEAGIVKIQDAVEDTNPGNNNTGNTGNTGAIGQLPLSPVAGVQEQVVVDLSAATTINTTGSNGNGAVRLEVDETKALAALKQHAAPNVAEINIAQASPSIKVVLTSGLIKEFITQGVTIKVNTPSGSYTLPAGEIRLEAIAFRLGSTQAALKVEITLAEVADTTKTQITEAAQASGLAVVGVPIEFDVEVTAGAQREKVSTFINYISREIKLPIVVNSLECVGVAWAEDGSFIPVPTQFITENGRTTAILKRKSNSIYAIVQSHKEFKDTKGHWAQGDIETLASKLVVNGKGVNTFAPEAQVTRAELAAILSRALALETMGATQFKDVPERAWYALAIQRVAEAGIITGYADGSFRPHALVTREEMAVMLVRTLQYLGVDTDLKAEDAKTQLASFKDYKQIGAWSAKYIAMAGQLEMIKGYQNGAFAPQRHCSRAEAMVMMKKMLATGQMI